MKSIESLVARIAGLEAAILNDPIFLSDGTSWRPKVSPLEALVSLMEVQCGEPIPEELLADIPYWSRYEPRPNDSTFLKQLSQLAKEVNHEG